MIKRGYYTTNKSLGFNADFERAFSGIEGSPLFEQVKKIQDLHPELYPK